MNSVTWGIGIGEGVTLDNVVLVGKRKMVIRELTEEEEVTKVAQSILVS